MSSPSNRGPWIIAGSIVLSSIIVVLGLVLADETRGPTFTPSRAVETTAIPSPSTAEPSPSIEPSPSLLPEAVYSASGEVRILIGALCCQPDKSSCTGFDNFQKEFWSFVNVSFRPSDGSNDIPADTSGVRFDLGLPQQTAEGRLWPCEIYVDYAVDLPRATSFEVMIDTAVPFQSTDVSFVELAQAGHTYDFRFEACPHPFCPALLEVYP